MQVGEEGGGRYGDVPGLMRVVSCCWRVTARTMDEARALCVACEWLVALRYIAR